ncbi:hypothetical protein KOW79_019088 [Hemibagrus wyckioides]|uniref:C-type lectin domain-containing protein n=1 Tax=Hemibagrus wyckioides TaxID=337641 RepID=A0A9D3N812_9TELE|nr:uncharacterized protein LOC131344314 [Hemibagrus wyckioides]KAG7318053.1 hypothetical protein KOW79_019088 [Hemibagrus wyckioides]
MLAIVLIISLLSQGQAVDYGTDFITAFPENLAYYFPATLSLQLKITSLLPNTVITVSMNTTVIKQLTNGSPQVSIVNINNAEVNQLGISGSAIRIISDKNITVFSISKRGDSVQSNLVPPTAHLGVEYLVPSLNYTELAVQMNTYNVSQFASSSAVLMDFSYRLLIINAKETDNVVTVTEKQPGGDIVTTITLGPLALTQLASSAYWFKVSSTDKVAVILTNPCVDSLSCRCNMIAHQLRPSELLGTEFIFPQFNSSTYRLFVTSAESVDLSCGSETRNIQPGSLGLLPYLPDLVSTNPILKTSKPSAVRVIRPGFIIDLLPKSMFAGCFLVHVNINTQPNALVIVETAQKDLLYIGSALATGTSWEEISGTPYSWDLITMTTSSSIIWHPNSPIAVYSIEKSGAVGVYGGPAISLNNEPDPNGCVVVPMSFELSNVTMSWQASRSYCTSKNEILVSPNFNYTQQKMVAALNSMNAEGYAWLGLRRNLVTSEWYWHRSVAFGFANWDNNQPAGGLCVSMRMEPNGNFTWSTVRCCSPMLPLCATDMVTVTTLTDVPI